MRTIVAHGGLSPLIEDDELVFQGHLGSFEFGDGSNNPLRTEVAFWVIVSANDQEAWVMASGLPNQVVQFLEVREVGRQQQKTFTKRMHEMNRIRSAVQIRFKGQFHLMACLPEKPSQQSRSAVVVQIELHDCFNCSRSRGDKSFGAG